MSPAAGNGAPLASSSADAPPADQANGTLGPVNVSLLPPGKLAPFVVPFRGGPGPLAGGPPSLLSPASKTSSDPRSMLLDAGEAGGACFPVSLWPVPPEYREAWEGKMAAANDVRAAVKKVRVFISLGGGGWIVHGQDQTVLIFTLTCLCTTVVDFCHTFC